MADELGRAYRHVTLAMSIMEQLAGELDGQDANQRPTASELVRQGVPVDRALAIVDGQQDRLRKLTGSKR